MKKNIEKFTDNNKIVMKKYGNLSCKTEQLYDIILL